MKTLWMIAGLGASVLSVAVAQSNGELAQTPKQRGLLRVEPQPAQVALEIWREQLAASDLDLREAAFDRCVKAARRDTNLRAEVQHWARDSTTAPELAWTARLVLRELGAPLRGFDTHSPWTFEFDPGFGGVDPQQWIEDQQRHWDALLGRVPEPNAQDTSSNFESFALEQSEGGVTCKVTRRQDGRDVTEEYSAASLEELLQAHPELREHIGADASPHFGGLRALRGFSLDGFGPFEGWNLDPPAAAPRASDEVVRTDVLGVLVQSLTVEEARALGLESGLGLRIERVEDGTIARHLGLQRNQVLIEINHVPIRTREDITAQIRARAANGELEVIVVDRWGQKRARTWKPDSGKQI